MSVLDSGSGAAPAHHGVETRAGAVPPGAVLRYIGRGLLWVLQGGPQVLQDADIRQRQVGFRAEPYQVSGCQA
ncbi:hypothetical protein GCM10010320_08570 [Streptomyces caelestis]|nr:hypothetical protein GCM10010320_08570 [Streptomyces caelestis]